MGAVDDALGDAIAAGGPSLPPLERPAAPTTVAGAAGLVAEGARQTPSRIAADLLGVDIRTVQRWLKRERGEGGEVRLGRPDLRKRLLAVARRRQLDRWRAENRRRKAGDPVGQIRRAGLLVRLRLWFGVYGKPGKVRTAPVEPGAPQHVPGSLCGPAMDAWQLGARDIAGDELLDAFWRAYGIDHLGVEVGEIDWATVVIA